jgi:hypothetical protein
VMDLARDAKVKTMSAFTQSKDAAKP